VKWVDSAPRGTPTSPNPPSETACVADLLGQHERIDQKEQLGFDFWSSKEMLDLYVACSGNVSLIASKLGLPLSTAWVGLSNQGLPGLGKSSEPKKALRLFYAGDSLDDACRKANVSRDLIEKLLRAGGRRLAMALDMMSEEEPELI
jgi:hypothetical protein